MRLAIICLALLTAVGCASTNGNRTTASKSKCVQHPRWGGPYELVSVQGYMIVIRDPRNGSEEKVMKKDFTSADCAKKFNK